jgi:two-component system chemotaxis response regulator CheB
MTDPPSVEAIVMGASAGAIETLGAILPRLPADFPVPILAVVHIPRSQDSLLANLYRRRCQMKICEAEDKLPIESGCVYFAPANYHLQVEWNRQISLSSEDPVNFSRPSIDILFETAADVYAERLLGIVLTGANHDGAAGLQAIAQAGGQAIVQHPEEAIMPTMPLAAASACPQAQVMKVHEMTWFLQNLAKPE